MAPSTTVPRDYSVHPALPSYATYGRAIKSLFSQQSRKERRSGDGTDIDVPDNQEVPRPETERGRVLRIREPPRGITLPVVRGGPPPPLGTFLLSRVGEFWTNSVVLFGECMKVYPL